MIMHIYNHFPYKANQIQLELIDIHHLHPHLMRNAMNHLTIILWNLINLRPLLSVYSNLFWSFRSLICRTSNVLHTFHLDLNMNHWYKDLSSDCRIVFRRICSDVAFERSWNLYRSIGIYWRYHLVPNFLLGRDEISILSKISTSFSSNYNAQNNNIHITLRVNQYPSKGMNFITPMLNKWIYSISIEYWLTFIRLLILTILIFIIFACKYR